MILCRISSQVGVEPPPKRLHTHLQQLFLGVPKWPQAQKIKNVEDAIFHEDYDTDDEIGPLYDAVQDEAANKYSLYIHWTSDTLSTKYSDIVQ